MKKPSAENLHKLATQFSDGIIFENDYTNKNIIDSAQQHHTEILTPVKHEEYYNSYEKFFSEALV